MTSLHFWYEGRGAKGYARFAWRAWAKDVNMDDTPVHGTLTRHDMQQIRADINTALREANEADGKEKE